MSLSDHINLDNPLGLEMTPVKFNEHLIKPYQFFSNEIPWQLSYPALKCRSRSYNSNISLHFISAAPGIIVAKKKNNKWYLYGEIDAPSERIKEVAESLNTHSIMNITNKRDIYGKILNQFREPIYNTRDFINLSGSKKKTVRQKIRKFKREHPKATIQYLNQDNVSSVLSLFNHWANEFKSLQKERGNNRGMVVFDLPVYRQAVSLHLDNGFTVGSKAYVVKEKGEILGAIAFANTTPHLAVTLYGYTKHGIDGLPEWMWYNAVEKSKHCFSYFNDGMTDAPDSYIVRKGFNNLYQYKDKFRPEKWLSLFTYEVE